MQKANEERVKQQRQIDSLTQNFDKLKQSIEKSARKRWFLGMIVGIFTAILLWVFDSWIISNLTYINSFWLDIVIKIAAIMLFTIPTAKFIELQALSVEVKQILIVILIVLVLLISQFLDDTKASILANYLEIAGVIGLGLYYYLSRRKKANS